MLSYLRQVDLTVWLFYIVSGFPSAKIRDELDIIRNKKHILQKQQELENKKIVPDSELIKSFPDEIFVPKNVSGGLRSYIFNSFLAALSQKDKNKILNR